MLITCQDWTDNQDYNQAWAPTNDPRVVAVIQKDDEASFERCLDGDAIFPTYLIEGDKADHAGGYDDDESLATAIVEARDRFRYAAGYRYNGLSYGMIAKADEMTARWAWIFHGTTFSRGNYGYQGDYDVLVMDTPAFRAHVGVVEPLTREESQAQVDAFAKSEVTAIADGDVYGIGYATFPERVTDEEPIDIEDGNWDITMESWSYVGDDWAHQAAAEYLDVDLPEMLTFA